jgi:hypothetical protein
MKSQPTKSETSKVGYRYAFEQDQREMPDFFTGTPS